MFILPIGVNFVSMLKYMYTMFILHKFYLFIYLMSADILACTFFITNLCLQVVLRSELFDTNTIMLAVRILIEGKYMIYIYYGTDQIAHSCADL